MYTYYGSIIHTYTYTVTSIVMVSLLAPNVLFYPMRKSTARTRGYIYSIHIPSGVCSTPLILHLTSTTYRYLTQ